MKVHFIAIGGSAMHNLAIALHKKGITVTGSDDEIFEPSNSRLAKYGLLPQKNGWDKNNINESVEAVILGMHARNDNPELLEAQRLGIKIFSYPEYLYEQSKNKTRVVIGGSHGKTTITAMILHVLNALNIECDYMVGAQLEGFDVMVKLTDNSKIMILEGDEYLTSPIDRRPKFHLYMPNIALISGIAWDHINVFPTFENYIDQFKIFIDLISEGGSLVYCEDDENVKKIALKSQKNIKKFGYTFPEHKIIEGTTIIKNDGKDIPISVFGKHNLANMNGARLVCNQLGVNDADFFEAIKSFSGASKRLELMKKNSKTALYKDFAHSPSKLTATIKAVKEQFPNSKLFACMELHTFSSLNKEFLAHYHGCMEAADVAIVYFSPHTIELKKLPPISVEEVKNAFGGNNIKVYTNSNDLLSDLLNENWENKNLLMMSSGNFDGIDFKELANQIIN
ncbi:MAG: peptidoglycan synthetase [Bacteroidetes bacterium]|nr:peptidoglycan synthetase [Bacteroidota bacterium]